MTFIVVYFVCGQHETLTVTRMIDIMVYFFCDQHETLTVTQMIDNLTSWCILSVVNMKH